MALSSASKSSVSVWLIVVFSIVCIGIAVAAFRFWSRGAKGVRLTVNDSKIVQMENHQRVAFCTEGKFGDLFIDFDEDCLYAIVDVESMGKMRVNFSLLGLFNFELNPTPAGKGGKQAFALEKTLSNDVLLEQMGKVAELGRTWEAWWPAVYAALMDRRREYETTEVPTAENATLGFEVCEDEEGEPQSTRALSLKLSPFDGFWGVEFSLDGTIHDAYVVY